MTNIAVEALQGTLPLEAQKAKDFIDEALAGTLEAPFITPSDCGNYQDIVTAVAEEYRDTAFCPDGSVENATVAVKRLVDKFMARSEAFKAVMESAETELEPVSMIDISVPPIPDRSKPDPKLAKKGRKAIDDITAFSMKWVPFADYAYHENAALWLLSTLTARRLAIKGIGDPIYTSLYLFFVGPSSCGKSRVAKKAKQVIDKLNMRYLYATPKITPEAFKRKLSGFIPDDWELLNDEKQERKLVELAFHGSVALFADEWGQHLRRLLNPAGYMHEWVSMYLSYEDSMADDGQESITNGRYDVENPYMPVLGCMTFSNIAKLPPSSDIWGSGLMSRACIAFSYPKNYVETQIVEGDADVPDDLLIRLNTYDRRLKRPRAELVRNEKAKDNDKPNKKYDLTYIEEYPCQSICLDEDVKKLYGYYINDINRIGFNPELVPEDIQPNYKRLPERALRAAAMLAWYDGEDIIRVHHWHAACEIAERWRTYLHQLYAQCFTPVESVKKGTIDSIMKFITTQSTQKQPRWVSISDVENWTKKTEDEFKVALEAKVRDGAIVRAFRPKKGGGGWHKFALPGIPLPPGYSPA